MQGTRADSGRSYQNLKCLVEKEEEKQQQQTSLFLYLPYYHYYRLSPELSLTRQQQFNCTCVSDSFWLNRCLVEKEFL